MAAINREGGLRGGREYIGPGPLVTIEPNQKENSHGDFEDRKGIQAKLQHSSFLEKSLALNGSNVIHKNHYSPTEREKPPSSVTGEVPEGGVAVQGASVCRHDPW